MDEAFAVGRLDQVRHFVDDDVFKQVFRFFHQLCIQADVTGLVIATAPLGFHTLQIVAGYFDAKFMLPPRNKRWYRIMQ